MFTRGQRAAMLCRHLLGGTPGAHLKPFLCGAGAAAVNLPFPAARGYATRVFNYYTALEITPKATASQIKANYYRLSKKYHPDMNKSQNAAAMFSDISEAYEVLGNAMKRQEYDRRFGRSSAFTGAAGTTVDQDYSEFLRHHGPFRKRGDAPTGRTRIYDFDEFYRMHYGEAIKDTQERKAAKERFDAQQREAILIAKRRLTVFWILFFLIIISSTKIPP